MKRRPLRSAASVSSAHAKVRAAASPKMRIGTIVLACITALACALTPALAFAPLPTYAESGSEAGISAGTSPDASEPTIIPGSISKVADPSTAHAWKELFGGSDGSSFSTDDAERLWVDKSVYASEEDAAASGIVDPSMLDADLDFLVSMSAFSSAASWRKEQAVPHDVVFVISLNSTLSSFHYDGRTYAEHLAEALNESIGRLMDENDGATPAEITRVAVVGYNIDTTVLMPLGAYKPDADGNYVKYAPDLPGGAGFQVTGTSDDAKAATANASFKGYAYLQRAFHVAADMLEQAAAESTADAPRDPKLMVMGSEVSTCANTDIANPPAYARQAQGEGGFLGTVPTGHSAGYGTDAALATLLTMQNDMLAIDAAYRPSGQSLSLYTAGLDTRSLGAYVLETADQQANAYVEGTGDAGGTNLCSNIDAARQAYAQAADQDESSVTLQLFSAGRSNLEAREIVFPNPIPGLLSADDGYAFRGADAYFPATDAGALDGSFNAAVDRILDITYLSPVDPHGDAASSPIENRIRFQDELGPLMQAKHIAGIQFQGKMLDGSLAAKALCTSFADPWDIEAYHELNYLMTSLENRYNLDGKAFDLLYQAYEAGQIAYTDADNFSNYAAWYVDADHEMVPSSSLPYTFAGTDEIAAARAGTWRDDPSSASAARLQAAQDAGATAVCQTYFFIGNLENQYSGADVPLYDFIVMVETNLDTSNQTVLFTAPADSIPARKASITLRLDGTTTMMLAEDAGTANPLQVVFEVGPRDDVADLARRVQTGDDVSAAEVEKLLGDAAIPDGEFSFNLLTNAYADNGKATGAGAAMSALAASTNTYYLFTRDTPLYRLKAGGTAAPDGTATNDQLEPLSAAPQAGETVYYEHVSYEADGLVPGKEVPVQAELTFLPLQLDAQSVGACHANSDGQWVVAAGTPRAPLPSTLEDTAKTDNLTKTAPFSLHLTDTTASDPNGLMLTARMGNNGTFTISTAHEDDETSGGDPDDGKDPDQPTDPDTGDTPGGGTEDPSPGDNDNDPSNPDSGSDSTQDAAGPTPLDTPSASEADAAKALSDTGDAAFPLCALAAGLALAAAILGAVAHFRRNREMRRQ